jgi:hypothetical protein
MPSGDETFEPSSSDDGSSDAREADTLFELEKNMMGGKLTDGVGR